jgi:hypothetical protein
MKSQAPPKPAPPVGTGTFIDRLDPTQRKVLLVGLVFFFFMAASTTLLLAAYIFEPEIASFFVTPTPTLTPTPTPQCVRPTLSLGAASYPLEVVSQPGNGKLPDIAGTAGTAWWVSDTFSPFVFLLTPGVGSPDLHNTLKPGDPLVVQWADCGREEFVLTDLQVGSPDAVTLLAQKAPGMAIIVQPVGNTPGYVIYGQRPELVNPPTPEPTDANTIMVDISFGDTAISTDGQTLVTRLTLTNRGANPLTLTTDDLSLTAEEQSPLSPLSVKPALPQAIPPGGSLSITVTLPNPGGHTAVLRVLDTTVDLYY